MQCFLAALVLAVTLIFIADQMRTLVIIRSNPCLGKMWVRLPLAVATLLLFVLIAFAQLCRLAQLAIGAA